MISFRLSIALSIIAVSYSSAAQSPERKNNLSPATQTNSNPHQLLEIIQCTILEPPGGYRSLSNLNTWPDGVIPYTFDANTTAAQRHLALDGMATIENIAGVLFIPRTGQTDYVNIRNSTGNSSFVGPIGGKQNINYAQWNHKGTVLHELLHALSFWHEHQRPDRDDFVEIIWANIQPGRVGNFTKRNSTIIGPYDFLSVMHYWHGAFSNCVCNTIVTRHGFEQFQHVMGLTLTLSPGDINALQQLYGIERIRNLRTNIFFNSMTEALRNALPHDTLIVNVPGIRQALDLVIPPQIRLVGIKAVENLPLSNWTLGHAASLVTLPPYAITNRGNINTAPGAWAFIKSPAVLFEQGSSLSLSPGSSISLNTDTADMHGVIDIGQGASLFIDSLSVTASANSAITLNKDAKIISNTQTDFQTSGSTRFLDNTLLFSFSNTFFNTTSNISVGPGASAQIAAPFALLNGIVRAEQGSHLVIDSDLLFFRPQLMSLAADSTFHITGVNTPLPSPAAFTRTTRTLSTSPPISIAIASGDINNDGLNDIAINDFATRGARVYLNQGFPLYNYSLFTTIPSQIRLVSDIELKDIDNDGMLDIILASQRENKLVILKQSKTSPLTFTQHIIDTAASGIAAIQIIDYDQDTDLDIIAALNTTSTLVLYEHTDPASTTFVRHTLSTDVSRPTDISAIDFDNDTDIDIIACSPIANSIVLLRNWDSATFDFRPELVTNASGGAQTLAVADFDNNNSFEIVSGKNQLVIYTHDAARNTFTPTVIDDAVILLGVVKVQDLNFDGVPEILASVSDRSKLLIYERAANPTDPWVSNKILFASALLNDFTFGDTNNNHATDIISLNSVSSVTLVLSTESEFPTITLKPNSTFLADEPIVFANAININSATLSAPSMQFHLPVSTHGTIQGDVTLHSPLFLTGPTTIDGDLTVLPTASIQLNGHNLLVTGTVTPPSALTSIMQPVSRCSTDLNFDNTIDGADLGIMLGSWGTPGPTDLNNDGTTDGADLGILLGAWGVCVGPM